MIELGGLLLCVQGDCVGDRSLEDLGHESDQPAPMYYPLRGIPSI